MERTILIVGSEQAIKEINANVFLPKKVSGHVTKKNNLDGNVTTWMWVGTIALQLVPHMLNYIKDQAPAKRPTVIKVGDVEITNPTPDQIEKLMARIVEKPSKKRNAKAQ